jgi:hypothetical protein
MLAAGPQHCWTVTVTVTWSRILATDAEAAEASQEPRETPAIDPERAREIRQAQTAWLQAQRDAEVEKMARFTPVTDAEMARYGTGAQAEPEPESVAAESARERSEALAGLREDISALGAEVNELARQDAGRAAERAEITRAAIDGPSVREPPAEPSLEPSWQPGSTQGQYEAQAEQGAGPEMEI